jgi:hypothetical protein
VRKIVEERPRFLLNSLYKLGYDPSTHPLHSLLTLRMEHFKYSSLLSKMVSSKGEEELLL